MNNSNTGNPQTTAIRTSSARSRCYAALCLASVMACAGAMACSDDDDSVGIGTPSNTGNGTGTSTNTGSGTNTGAGTSGGTTGGGTTGAAGGTGAGTSGTGGSTATGGGGATSTGTGGSTSTGAGAATSTGAGGSVSAGANGTSGTDMGAAAATALVNSAQQLEDDEIVFVADTINLGEVEQANAALPRLSNDDVRAYAERMIEEHTTASEELTQLAQQEGIEPDDSDLSDTLQQQSQAVVQRLEQASDETIDAEYINSQVSVHEMALLVARALIAAADNEALRAQLATLSGHIEEHRAEAAEIAQSIE